MHSISRRLFVSQVVLLAGCPMQSVFAKSASGYIPLSHIARRYSMQTTVAGKKVTLKNKWNTLEFETDARRAWINGVQIYLHYKCHKRGSSWALVEADYKKGIDPILRSYAYVPSKLPRVVVLDPGHGGKDTGAIGKRKVYEKKAVLSIASKVKSQLESKGIKVLMTRSTDVYPTLQQRCDFAEKVNADLFVSIHADGATDPSACGVETFVMTAPGYYSTNHYGQPADKSALKGNLHDGANAILGFSIQSNLVKTSKRNDRGLRRGRFYVLKNAPCPAALVECGFVTNPEEEALLIDPAYRESVARGISNGIQGYFTLVKRAAR